MTAPATDSAARVHQLIGRAVSGAVLPYILLAGLAAVAVFLVGRDVEHHLNAMEAWVVEQGPRGWAFFAAGFVPLTSLLVPESILSILAGALFGPVEGLAVVLASSMAAAAFQYGLARGLLRAKIERLLDANPPLAAIRRVVLSDELRLQGLLRLTPLNPASLSYAMGAAGVRFPGFLLTSLATTPHLLLEVWVGYAGKHVAHMAGRSVRGIIVHDLLVAGGLALCLIVVLYVSRLARRAVEEAVAAEPVAGAGAPV